MRSTPIAWLFCALALAFCADAGASAARTFVSTAGSDSNTGTNCAPLTPCRSFGAALGVTASGGEVVVLDSGGYGPPFTITQDVTITAPAGVYAAINVPVTAQAGVEINGTGIHVTLRGLTFEGAGGADAIRFDGGAALTVERCSMHAFAESGIYINSMQSHVTVLDSTIEVSNGTDGISLEQGADLTVRGSTITGAFRAGIYALSLGASLRVSDSLISGNATGIAKLGPGAITVSNSRIEGSRTSGVSATGALTFITVTGSEISGNGDGFTVAPALIGEGLLSIKNSLLSGNSNGINGSVGALTSTLLIDVSDSVLADSNVAVLLSAVGTGVMHAAFARTSLTGNAVGASLAGGGGTADMTLAGCVITNNTTGLQTVATSGAFKGFLTLGNNTFVGNGTDVNGTITSLGPR